MGARPSTFVTPPVEAKPVRTWTAQHEAIFAWFQNDDGPHVNLVVTARAGATKTSTLVEGVNRAFEPSILVCAFSKLIANELVDRITNPAVDVMTLHALGLRLIRREWRGIPVCEDAHRRADSLTDAVLSSYERESGEKTPYIIRRMISALHTKGREMVPLSPTLAHVEELAYRFDHVPDSTWGRYDMDFVATHALAAMVEAETNPPTYDIGVDYADMIYLPLVWNLTARDYQLVVVDEAQDLTLAQLEIAQRSCSGRLCMVGDDRQAIFGFRGAEIDSLFKLTTSLQAATLPLTVTYRCPKTVTALAQTLVPDIEARPNAPEGIVDEINREQLVAAVRPGDFVLSRANAPLVSIVLACAKHGVRARMVGRDIGKDILRILQRLKCDDRTPMALVIDRIRMWDYTQSHKLRNAGHDHLIWRVKDQAEMLIALAEDAESMSALSAKISALFVEPDEEAPPQVICSTVHKAKGLEADHVYVLMTTLYPRGKRTQEEANIHYVAVTRARQHLTLVR